MCSSLSIAISNPGNLVYISEPTQGLPRQVWEAGSACSNKPSAVGDPWVHCNQLHKEPKPIISSYSFVFDFETVSLHRLALNL